MLSLFSAVNAGLCRKNKLSASEDLFCPVESLFILVPSPDLAYGRSCHRTILNNTMFHFVSYQADEIHSSASSFPEIVSDLRETGK